MSKSNFVAYYRVSKKNGRAVAALAEAQQKAVHRLPQTRTWS